MKIAILGSGHLASRLSPLLSDAGHHVMVCTRHPADGAQPSYADGANAASIVVLAFPFGEARAVLAPLATALAGKIVVDATNPIKSDWSPMLLGQENSAGEEIARLVPQARVVKAFNTIFADTMHRGKQGRAGLAITAFIASDDRAASHELLRLADQMGFAPIDAGPLKVSRYLEAMAHLNIQLAKDGGTDAAFIYHQAPH